MQRRSSRRTPARWMRSLSLHAAEGRFPGARDSLVPGPDRRAASCADKGGELENGVPIAARSPRAEHPVYHAGRQSRIADAGGIDYVGLTALGADELGSRFWWLGGSAPRRAGRPT